MKSSGQSILNVSFHNIFQKYLFLQPFERFQRRIKESSKWCNCRPYIYCYRLDLDLNLSSILPIFYVFSMNFGTIAIIYEFLETVPNLDPKSISSEPKSLQHLGHFFVFLMKLKTNAMRFYKQFLIFILVILALDFPKSLQHLQCDSFINLL